MPVRVEPRGDQYCVVSVETGASEKCYDNKSDADAYAAVLNLAYANKKGYVHNDLPLDGEIKQELSEWPDIE